MGYYTSWDDPVNGGNYPVSAIDWDGLTHVATAFYLPDGNGGWASRLVRRHDGGAHHRGGARARQEGHRLDRRRGLGRRCSRGRPRPRPDDVRRQPRSPVGHGLRRARHRLGGRATSRRAGPGPRDRRSSPPCAGKSPASCSRSRPATRTRTSSMTCPGTGPSPRTLDRINLMTYGMSGACQGWESWHSSPLHWNKNQLHAHGHRRSVTHYLAAGVPAAKLGVGSGFYGECYTSPVTAPAQALGGSTLVASDGTMSYTNIMSPRTTWPRPITTTAPRPTPYLTLSVRTPRRAPSSATRTRRRSPPRAPG